MPARLESRGRISCSRNTSESRAYTAYNRYDKNDNFLAYTAYNYYDENDNFLANSDEADIYGLLEMAGVEVRHGG